MKFNNKKNIDISTNEKFFTILKTITKDFNICLILLLASLLTMFFSSTVTTFIMFIFFSILFSYKILVLNLFLSNLEEILKPEINQAERKNEYNNYILKNHKGVLLNKRNIKEDVLNNIKNTEHKKEDVLNEDISKDKAPKIEVESKGLNNDMLKEKVLTEKEDKEPLNSDNLKEQCETRELEIDSKEKISKELTKEIINEPNIEEIKEKGKEVKVNKSELITEIDISKYIRKLPEGKTASKKTKEIARMYGYELKDGETFINPKLIK